MKFTTNNAARLRADLQGMAHDIEQLLHNMGDATEEEFGTLRMRGRSRLHAARERLDRVGHGAAVRLRDVGGRTQDYVQHNPWRVIGIAAATAYLMGMLIRSRR